MIATIYESKTVRIVATDRGSDTVVITFASVQRAPSLATPPFGLSFLEKSGLSAIGVIGAGNDWYQYPDMPEALAAIGAEAGERQRVTYGSSMGGYAALSFAAELSATRSVSISPTAAIKPGSVTDRSLVPEYLLDSPDYDWRPVSTGAGENFVLFDPLRPRDRVRVEQIAQKVDLRPVPVPFGGHPASHLLADAGLLSGVVKDLIDGTWSDTRQRRMIADLRARRRACWRFYFNVAESLPPHRQDLSLALLRLAAEMGQPSATERDKLDRALTAASLPDEADPAAEPGSEAS